MKVKAEQYLRQNYEDQWSPDTAMEVGRVEVESCRNSKRGKKRKDISLVGSMLAMEVDSESDDNGDDEEDKGEENELVMNDYEIKSEVDRYLQLPQASYITETGKDVDILEWWKHHSSNFPNLSKMARQFLALPCSSAGKKTSESVLLFLFD